MKLPGILLPTNLSPTIFIVGALMFVLLLIAGSAFAGNHNYHVIYAFQGGNDGIGSNDVIADRAGNLYGTTFNGGGPAGAGTVYELSPPAHKGGAWTETILYSFSYAQLESGIGPMAGLVMDPAGNLYGTTWLGGPAGGGLVFELSPPAQKGGAWTYSLVYDFSAPNDGYSPEARLTLDPAGNLYGTTTAGGTGGCAGGCGTVFKLAPPTQPGGAWIETVLYNFPGSFPYGGGTSAGVTLDANGALYGTTFRAGGGRWGTVFRLTPPKTRHGKHWAHTVLYAFAGGNDGAVPQSDLVFDKNGDLYGTTTYGGGGTNCLSASCGTVFQLTPTPSGPWTHSVLYTFRGGNDGGDPQSGVTLDAAGNVYGTTLIGGDPSCGGGTGCGTVFQLGLLGGTWTETILHRFTGGSDGAGPGGLTFGKGKLLCGPAGAGANSSGLLFSITQ